MPILAGVSVLLGAVVLAVLEAGPGFRGLAELVLAGNPDGAREAMLTWSPNDRLRIAFVAGFDFVFGITWTTTLALACIWSARRSREGAWRATGVALAWSAWVALAFDIPENGAYFAMVMGSTGSPWPQMAVAAAISRCVILAAGLVYLAAAFAIGRSRGPGAGESASGSDAMRKAPLRG